jgi:hypothetical protein
MKNIFTLFALVMLLPCIGVSQDNKKDDATLPYGFSIPDGWSVERIPFPIEFAPQIAYKGIEELRFTPGWGNPKSEEHWSYAFLWWIEGSPRIDTGTLQQDLKAYYTGLVGRNITKRQIPASKVVPTNASIKKIRTAPGDLSTYTGTISMLNYITQTPIVLHCRVHVKNCQAQHHTIVYFEISPKHFTHPIWAQYSKMLTLNTGCGN